MKIKGKVKYATFVPGTRVLLQHVMRNDHPLCGSGKIVSGDAYKGEAQSYKVKMDGGSTMKVNRMNLVPDLSYAETTLTSGEAWFYERTGLYLTHIKSSATIKHLRIDACNFPKVLADKGFDVLIAPNAEGTYYANLDCGHIVIEDCSRATQDFSVYLVNGKHYDES